MRIAETFHSIQGEGKLTGIASFFIRVSGCNLRCHWCDTPYASWHPQGDEASPLQLLEHARDSHCHHIVLTGGEPLIVPEIEQLCVLLASEGLHLTIETSGTHFKPLPVDLVSLSPKLSNSTPTTPNARSLAVQHDNRRLNLDALQRWIDTAPDLQMKFVLQSPSDLDEMHGLLGQLRRWRPSDILLMPEGTTPAILQERSQWLIETCKTHGYRFCQRLHIMVWGDKRGV